MSAPMLTTIFFHEVTVSELHETLEDLGAVPRSSVVCGESIWILPAGDGDVVRLHAIEDFDRYSIELWIGVLLKLASAIQRLGRPPRVALEVESEPESEQAARQLVQDVLAIHSGVSHDDADPDKPLAPEEWAEAKKRMGW